MKLTHLRDLVRNVAAEFNEPAREAEAFVRVAIFCSSTAGI